MFNVTRTGANFDTTWDTPFTMHYVSTAKGYCLFYLQIPTKTGTAYPCMAIFDVDIRIDFISGTDSSVGIANVV